MTARLLPQLLYYISMPVQQNARILEPLDQSRTWPVMVFSHGLGGSRNAYSHICGSLASHGLVVVAPQHRDGSAPLSVLQTPDQKEKTQHVEYRPIAHKPSAEVYKARDEQLRIRLWEMGLVCDALTKMDQGMRLTNVAPAQPRKNESNLLSMFHNILHVHEPGAISFTGHSFGACTMIQFVKSVYYRGNGTHIPHDDKPLFTPSPTSSLIRQITPATPVTLLDLWTLPIQSPDTAWLRAQPMPCYDAPTGGQTLLAIASEGFYNWSTNFRETQRLLAKPARSRSRHPDQVGPHIFYPVASAHLSQSDFGILFPWVTTKVFGAKEPERVLKLNTRAILQMLRENGVRVANTSAVDLEIDEEVAAAAAAAVTSAEVAQDTAILSRKRDSVRGWVSLSGDVEGASDGDPVQTMHGDSLVDAPDQRVGSDGSGPGDAMLQGETFGPRREK